MFITQTMLPVDPLGNTVQYGLIMSSKQDICRWSAGCCGDLEVHSK